MSKFKGQLDIVNENSLKFPIHVIGAGGIGSWTTLLLAKMGCKNINVYDFDVVEEHNTASQFFKPSQLGLSKLDALEENVFEQTGIKILKMQGNNLEEKIDSGLVIFALDSMERRIELGNVFKDKDLMIIDGRMGGTQMEVYSAHSSRYLSTTIDPALASQEPCTRKAISFNCACIGGMIANQTRHYANKKLKEECLLFLFDENRFFVSDVKEQVKEPETIALAE
jgi:tRNA A37 threonylcarbamoyladenosine dehydratase